MVIFDEKVKFAVIESYIEGQPHDTQVAIFNHHSDRKRYADEMNKRAEPYVRYYVKFEWNGV